MRLVNTVLSTKILPETGYYLDKLCDSNNNVTFHSVCTYCTEYLGTFDKFNKSIECPNCKKIINTGNPSDPCFFAIIDPSDAIRDYIKIHEDYYDEVVKNRVHEKGNYKDIYDGKGYRFCVNSLQGTDRFNYVTLIHNADAIPIFYCSRYSITSMFLMPNEIPPQDRMSSLVLVGLWFGKKNQ